MVQFNYNTGEVKPSSTYEVLPSDWYIAQIVASEAKTPRSGQGQMLNVTFEIIDGDHRGRKIWNNYCIIHPNAKTQEIARSNLAALSHACGVPQPGCSEQLHHIPVKIKVKVKKDKNDEWANEVTGYASIERVTKTPPSAGQAATTPQNDSTPPWMNRQ